MIAALLILGAFAADALLALAFAGLFTATEVPTSAEPITAQAPTSTLVGSPELDA